MALLCWSKVYSIKLVVLFLSLLELYRQGQGWIVRSGIWRYRKYMLNQKTRIFGALFGVLLLLGACVTQEPYVLNANEFNRESPNFAKEIKDRNNVEICYNKKSTTPARILAMAEIECAKFGKRAVFKLQKTLSCSIAAPALAEFYCLAPGDKANSVLSKK